MKNIKLLSIFCILTGSVLCVLFMCKFIELESDIQFAFFLVGIAELLGGITLLILNKIPKVRNNMVLSETDEREIFIRYKSGYIAGYVLSLMNVICTALLSIYFWGKEMIPGWVILCPVFMSMSYVFLFIVCSYFMRNKK